MGFVAKALTSLVKKITGIADITPIDKLVGKAIRKTHEFEEKTALKLDKSFMPAPPKLPQQVVAPAAAPPVKSTAKKADTSANKASPAKRRSGRRTRTILSEDTHSPTILGK